MLVPTSLCKSAFYSNPIERTKGERSVREALPRGRSLLLQPCKGNLRGLKIGIQL